LGQAFKVECIDYSGGQLVNDDNLDDILHMDHDSLVRVPGARIQLTRSDHHISGPFHVPGALPGDVLEIDILEYVFLPISEHVLNV
jgi:formamidase